MSLERAIADQTLLPVDRLSTLEDRVSLVLEKLLFLSSAWCVASFVLQSGQQVQQVCGGSDGSLLGEDCMKQGRRGRAT